MIKTLSKFKDISVVDQNKSDNLYTISDLGFEDNSIGSGGFGTVYDVKSIDGEESNKYVVKLFDKEESQEHAYETISILHEKIKKHQSKNSIPIFHEYPELLGLPFIAFKAYSDIEEKDIIGFLMYDLSKIGFEDYGADNEINILNDVEDVTEKIFYAYKLAKVISFLHENKFIHADISENAIWINKKSKQLALIDYDSGFHYDVQEKPTTIGKITQWIGGRFRNLIGNNQGTDEMTVNERVAEENWILANAIFEIITGLMPYFYLSDVDDKTKKKYLKIYSWPNIDSNCKVYNQNNEEHHKYLINFVNQLQEYGLTKLTTSFKKVFNSGYSNDNDRLSTKEWNDILFSTCEEFKSFVPKIKSFNSNKRNIKKKHESINFTWETHLVNAIYIDGQLIPLFSKSHTLKLEDGKSITLKVVNDFGVHSKKINIDATRVIPQIKYFTSSKSIRDSIEPIILSWKVEHASKVIISNISNEFKSKGDTKVEPRQLTKYKLTAYGSFDEEASSSLNIDIARPIINNFSWEINLDYGLDNIDLLWDTINTENVSIEPKVGIKSPSGIEHISISESSEFTLTANGIFTKEVKIIKAYPFPVPVIKSIFTENPKIELNYNFDSKNLTLPKAILETSKISFNNSINLNTKINYDIFTKLESADNFIIKPEFIENNKLIELYNKEQISINKIFNKIKEIIYKKLNNYETKANN